MKAKQNDNKMVRKMKTILSPFILRRIKSMVLTQIAPKEEEILTIPISPFLQQKIYQDTLLQSKNLLKKHKSLNITSGDSTSKKKKGNNFQNILMNLRKVKFFS